jgi:hypothetical protein
MNVELMILFVAFVKFPSVIIKQSIVMMSNLIIKQQVSIGVQNVIRINKMIRKIIAWWNSKPWYQDGPTRLAEIRATETKLDIFRESIRSLYNDRISIILNLIIFICFTLAFIVRLVR